MKRSFDDLPKPLGGIAALVVVIFLLWLFFTQINPKLQPVNTPTTSQFSGNLTQLVGGLTETQAWQLFGIIFGAILIVIGVIAYFLLKGRNSGDGAP